MVTRILPLLFVGLSLVAQPGPQAGPPKGRPPLPFMLPLRALNLTETQKADLHRIFEGHKDSLRAKSEAAGNARKAVGDALTQPGTTEAQLKSLHDAAAAAQFEVLKEGRALFLQVDPLLTPEQRAKAQELKASFHQHMDGLRDFAFGH